jgi:NAD(P)-dependent dehydrogenase (short-subunit alcohol dehydrogenase family)
MLNADLSLMSDTARLAREIAARTDRIDVLINNAGGTPSRQVITEEGYEATFTGNHLGHFLLTHRLLPLLKRTAAGRPKGSVRIINTSSSAHEHSPGFDWDDLQMLKTFTATPSYMNAKLANVYFTRSLAKRLGADGIAVHAVHPGMVATNFASYGDEAMQKHFVVHADRAISAAAGADTLIWASTSPEAGQSSGGYFFERKPGVVSAPGRDDAAAERLWRESEALVAKVGQAVA